MRTRALTTAGAALAALVACKQAGSGSGPPPRTDAAAAPVVVDAAPDPEAAEAERVLEEMTAGAIDGGELMGFVPASLAGVERSNRVEQVFAVAAAYQLDDGSYANLDIKNSFRRGGIDLEDQLMRACKKSEPVAGYVACVVIRGDRTSFHWDLKDRITVDLSAPDGKLARTMANELPLAALAKLSAAATSPVP